MTCELNLIIWIKKDRVRGETEATLHDMVRMEATLHGQITGLENRLKF
jgi:hypothetical protein